jgi:hypothetical protein
LALPAAAQGDRERAAARSLATEGIQAYTQGNDGQALDLLRRAYELAPIPTIGVWLARALVKDGQLVEASERYLAAQRFQLKPNDPPVFAEAQKEATTEQASLAPRIPQLTIQIRNASGTASVKLDDAPLAGALIGVPFSLNPGARRVTATVGAEARSEQLVLAEGEARLIVLDFSPTPASAGPSAPGPAKPPAVANTPPVDSPLIPPSGSKPIAGYVVLGLGGAALITGGGFGIVALRQHSELEEDCPDGLCPEEKLSNSEIFETNQAVALVCLGTGAILAGIGAWLVLSHDSKPSKPSAVTPWLGIGSVGLRGRF